MKEVFERLDTVCYNHVCQELNSMEEGRTTIQDYYDHAHQCNKCCKPIMEATFNYHKQKVQGLDHLAFFYNSNISYLSYPQKKKLKNFINKYKYNYNDYRFLIIGRASKVGDPLYNEKLSNARGKNVKRFINKAFGDDAIIIFSYFGDNPPQLDKQTAKLYNIRPSEYEPIRYGKGSDNDYALRLNQSVILVIYPKKNSPFDLVI